MCWARKYVNACVRESAVIVSCQIFLKHLELEASRRVLQARAPSSPKYNSVPTDDLELIWVNPTHPRAVDDENAAHQRDVLPDLRLPWYGRDLADLFIAGRERRDRGVRQTRKSVRE